MTEFKLGCLPGKIPVGLHDLTFYASGSLPNAPALLPVPAPLTPTGAGDGTPWGVDGNDTYGDCGVAGINHGFMIDYLAVKGAQEVLRSPETFPSDDEIIAYYLAYTGGQDTGVVLSDFLAYVKQKGFFGHSVGLYAPVGVHDVPTLHFAIWAYGFAYTGIKVTQAMLSAAQQGREWTLGDLLSPVAGGHCIPLVGYDSKHLYAITWGQVQAIDYSAWHYMSSEAWAVISGEFAAANGDTRGISLSALEADLNKIAD